MDINRRLNKIIFNKFNLQIDFLTDSMTLEGLLRSLSKKGLKLEKEARELDEKALLAYHSEQAKFDLYQRLAGEAEARAVQKRMNMTDTQRRVIFPYESYDVPVNQLIVRTK